LKLGAYVGRLFEWANSGRGVLCCDVVFLFLEDEVHVAELSARIVTFNHGCHLAQLHPEFFHSQDVWCIADSGKIVPIEGGLKCQCNLRTPAGTCHHWFSYLYFVYTPHQSLKLNADSAIIDIVNQI
jgi:hypothetical protein